MSQTLGADVDGDHAASPLHKTTDPFTAYVSNIEQEQVRTAIQQLPLEFREVIILREYEELSYEEIASLLGCPVGTVMSRLARARSKLKDLLLGAAMDGPSEKKSAGDDKQTPAWRQAGGG